MNKWKKLDQNDLKTQLQNLKSLYGDCSLPQEDAKKRKETGQGSIIIEKSTSDKGQTQKRL
jgi:hypothetical protein